MFKRFLSSIIGVMFILLSVLPVRANSLDGYRLMTVTVDATDMGGAFSKRVEVLSTGIPAVKWNNTLTDIVNNIMTQTDRDNVADGKFVTAKITIQSEDYDALKTNYDLTDVEKAYTNLVSMDIRLNKILSSDREGTDVLNTDNLTSVPSAIEISFDEPVIPSGKYIKSYKLLHLGTTVENIACDYKNHKFIARLKDFSPYVFYYELADKPKEAKKDDIGDDSGNDNPGEEEDNYEYVSVEKPVYIPVPITESKTKRIVPDTKRVKADLVKGKLGHSFVEDPDHHVVIEEEPAKEIIIDNPIGKANKNSEFSIYVGVGLGLAILLIAILIITKILHDRYEEYSE